ncbi:ATP-binding protein [Bdellovibrio sp. GT3]|uniref:ATP-binding protein n=1 Tax=Bdellovibrio sp. GT3 TaxID=3136282 RepID=UPI0030F1A3EE
MSYSNYLPKSHNLLSFVVLVISAIVMVGWLVQDTGSIRLGLNYTPMLFNTAFLLAFISLGVLFSDRDYFKVGRACAIVVMILAGAMFLQYPLGKSFGIDEFFVRDFENLRTRFPGRSAASTCIAAFLLGLGIFFNKTTLLCRFVRMTVASMVCCVGVVGLSGNVFSINSQFGWGSFSKMAPHTSVCIVLLSVALVLQLRSRMLSLGYHRKSFRPYYALVIGVFATIGFQQVLIIKDYQKNRSITQIRLSAMLDGFDSTFRFMNSSLANMAERFVLNDYRGETSWQLDAKMFIQEIKGIRRVMWAGNDRLVKWHYPISENINFNGLKLSEQPGSLGLFDKVISTKQPTISDMVPLKTGGEGLVMYYPVFRGNELLGVLSIALDANLFFNNAAKAPDYFVQITDDDGHLFMENKDIPQYYLNDWAETAEYHALNANWTFMLTPDPALVRTNSSSLPTILLIFGVSVSILMSLSLVFFLRSRQSEREMRELNEWHKAGRDSVSLLLLQLDSSGNVLSLNKATTDLLGYTDQDLLGRPVFTLAEHTDALMYRSRMEEKVQRQLQLGPTYLEAILESGDASGYERVFVSKSGKRINFLLSLHRVSGEQGETNGYLVVGEDITQRRERERLLKEREEKVMVSSRLASLGEMAAGIAHEINNPLAVMGGYMSVIRKSLNSKGLGNDVELNKRIDSVESMVGRIAKIVKGLRSYAHESALDELESTEVSLIVDDTLAFCHEKFKLANIQLQVSVEPGMIVKCRPYQISQVLLNLLNNAFDAVEHESVKKVSVQAQFQKGGVEISVADSGPGIPAEVRERMMQPFFTTKEVGKGVGLGLSISVGIVEAHKGRLYLDAQSKQTRFVIWLPS